MISNTIFIIVSLINSFTLTFSMTNLLPYPINRPNRVAIYVYTAFCQITFFLYIGQSILFFTIGGALLIIVISNKHYIANSLFSLVGYLFAILINYLLTVPLNIMHITITYMSTYNYITLVFVMVYCIITYIITYFIGQFIRKKVNLIDIIIPRKIQLFLFLEIILCTSIFICNILLEEKKGYPSEIVYFNALLFGTFFIITLIIFFFCLRILQKNHELLRVQQEKKSLEEYMKKIEDLYQDMRRFKHDYMNILSTMKYYIDNDESENLKEYFQAKILPTSEKLVGKDAIIGQLSNIKLLELKGILYSKLVSAMNQELNITLEIHDEVDLISMEMLDLATIIGIFMDNAIEAAQESRIKNLVILIVNNPELVTIIISNSTDDTSIELDHIYEKDTSSKEGHCGLGLYSVNKILENYNNVIHSTNFENNIFTQKLEICTTC